MFVVLGCTVEGSKGNGTAQGTCDREYVCQEDGLCKPEGIKLRVEVVMIAQGVLAGADYEGK